MCDISPPLASPTAQVDRLEIGRGHSSSHDILLPEFVVYQGYLGQQLGFPYVLKRAIYEKCIFVFNGPSLHTECNENIKSSETRRGVEETCCLRLVYVPILTYLPLQKLAGTLCSQPLLFL